MSFEQAVALGKAEGWFSSARLHMFGFRTGTVRLWEGVGPLRTNDAQLWDGIGPLAQSSGGGWMQGLTAPSVKLTMAGDSESVREDILLLARNSTRDVYGRGYRMFVQYFDKDQMPIGLPEAVFVGMMDKMTITRSASVLEVGLTVEGFFVRKSTPRVRYFSAADQRSRFAGDGFLDRLTTPEKAPFPNYT
jgi:hypothetical protein